MRYGLHLITKRAHLNKGEYIMIVISEYFSEQKSTAVRAEVFLNSDEYGIRYYSIDGGLIKEEAFPGKSLTYVEDAAENWAKGIKVLNG